MLDTSAPVLVASDFAEKVLTLYHDRDGRLEPMPLGALLLP